MTDELQRWLKESALPLRSLDVEACDNDLEPLRHVLDDVRVLGMGEATHGTAEFFRLKHRLLGFLVREMGFTTLAMEASASAARAVDDYVVNGTGNAADALAGLGFWTWRTHEMLAVVEWMRAHNRTAPPERVVRFAGIDPQRCAHSLAVLRELLPTVAPEQAGILDGPLGALADAGPGAGAADGGRALDEARELLRFLACPAPSWSWPTSPTVPCAPAPGRRAPWPPATATWPRPSSPWRSGPPGASRCGPTTATSRPTTTRRTCPPWDSTSGNGTASATTPWVSSSARAPSAPARGTRRRVRPASTGSVPRDRGRSRPGSPPSPRRTTWSTSVPDGRCPPSGSGWTSSSSSSTPSEPLP